MFNFCITFAHCDRNDFTKSCSFFSQMAMHEVAVYGTWDLTRMLYILSFFGGTMKNLLTAYRVFCEEKHVLRRRNNQRSKTKSLLPPKNPSPRRNSSEHLSQNKCFFYHSTCLLSVKEKSGEVFFGVRTEKSVMWFDGFIAGWRRMLWCYTDKDYVIVWWEARNSERSWRLLRQKNSGRVMFRMRGILSRAFSCSL